MNKYSHFNRPERTLDFHECGILDGAGVKRATERFVDEARAAGLRRIRIVTGRGRHSTGRPLVGPQVRRTLKAMQNNGVIVSYADAKVGEGGEGAVDVVLASG